MPFAKWNLEPVFVSRTLPWAHTTTPLKTIPNTEPSTTTNGEHKSQPQPPLFLKDSSNNIIISRKCVTKSSKVSTNNDQQDSRTGLIINGQGGAQDDDHIKDIDDDDDDDQEDQQQNGNEVDVQNENHDGQKEDSSNTNASNEMKMNKIEPQQQQQQQKQHSSSERMSGVTRTDKTASASTQPSIHTVHACLMTDDELVLLKIHNRTMVGIIRQMASLLSTSDQMFTELTDECRRLMDRSQHLRERFVKLSNNIDRLNHQMRHSAPRIGDIHHYQREHDEMVKNREHWKCSKPLDRCLFSIESRPLSVRNLYGRAHAPGDVRLSCSIFSPFGPLLSSTAAGQRPTIGSQHQIKSILNQPTSSTTNRQCQCQCGQCHKSNDNSQQNDGGDKLNFGQTSIKTVLVVDSYDGSDHRTSRSCECCSRNDHDCSASAVANGGGDVQLPNESSSSSIVTWSSVTSSTFEPISNNNHHHHQISSSNHHETMKLKTTAVNHQTTIKCKVQPMSSFSSSGEYYPNDATATTNSHSTNSANPIKTIDDFFRKNNVIDRNDDRVNVCVCSCVPKQPPNSTMALSRQTSSNATINQIQLNGQLYQQPPDYWWWYPYYNHDGDDVGRRRWSSALTGSSPLKPTMLDEMTIWLRENIETRRPESIVFKSASELPNDVLLERALSPPCSSHTITLNNKNNIDQMIFNKADHVDDDNNGGQPNKTQTFPRLKRRWSLLPFRRHLSFKRFGKNRNSLTLDSSTYQRNDLFDENATQQLHIKQSSHEHILIDHQQNDKQKQDDEEPKEIVLMSPDERNKLLADQFADSTMVSIDVSGKYFDRLSNTRRSLIHTDFHIPRNKVSGYHRRSRSKSPHHTARSANKAPNNTMTSTDVVSPYALGQLKIENNNQQSLQKRTMVIEKGCQTDPAAMNKHQKIGPNRFVVPIEVHRNANDGRYYRNHYDYYDENEDDDDDDDDEIDGDEDEDEYVVILKKHHNNHHHYHHPKHRIDDTTSSNASDVELAWQTRTTNIKNEPGSSDTGNNNINNKSIVQPFTISSTNRSKNFDLMKTQFMSKNDNNLNMIRQRMIQYNNAIQNTIRNNIGQQSMMTQNSQTKQSKGQQNGARSSSGNWSAATSDLIHTGSSSSSSSPPLHVTDSANNNNNTVNNRRHHFHQMLIKSNQNNSIKDAHSTSTATTTTATTMSTTITTAAVVQTTTTTTTTASHNEEAESVYSVDNDGYYTSMHTDSGLFLGMSNSLPPQTHHQRTSSTSTFTSQTSLDRRQKQQQMSINHKKKTDNESNNYRPTSLMTRWKNRFNHHQTSTNLLMNNSSKRTSVKISASVHNHPKMLDFLKNIDDDDDDDDDERLKNTTPTNKTNLKRSTGDDGSNLSINSILSNSDAATADTSVVGPSGQARAHNRDSMVDFDDCSVSHCSHQVHYHSKQKSKDHVGQTTTTTTTAKVRNKLTERLRTASGTYQYDDASDTLIIRSSSSSSETLHTNDYDEEASSLQEHHHQQQHLDKYHHRQTMMSNAQNNRKQPLQRYASLTDGSSSNSSSCRKLPPPPPPPRVSSMLRTLQKYSIKRMANNSNPRNDDNSAVTSLSSCTSAEQNFTTSGRQQRSMTDAGNAVGATDLSITSQSETNSEYLLNNSNDERRRRLFLDVDSNRSYPPISYINDQTDTATSVSIPSSTCLDEDLDDDNLTVSTNNNNNNALKTTPKTSGSSRTITPVPSETGENTDSGSNGNQLSNSVINLDANNANNNFKDQQQQNKKQLEERHLSSPLPPPKLDSFTLKSNHHHHHHHHHQSSPKLRTKSSSSTDTKHYLLSSTSSLSSCTVKGVQSSSESIPKPKPRNSLILTSNKTTTSNNCLPTTSSTVKSSTFSTNNTENKNQTSKSSPDSTASSSSMDNKDEQKKTNAKSTNVGRRLTTEDLFIILHNSKKRHNIRADPQLFPPSNRLSSPNSSTSPSHCSRSPMVSPDHAAKSSSPTSPTTNETMMKRRSWTGTDTNATIGNNTARTRQSLALDRLGPVRPTTLNDFKRLLAQVRSSPTGSSANNNNATSPTSTYTALQQILRQPTTTANNSGKSSPTNTTTEKNETTSQSIQSPSSSGVSSLSSMSPLLSPMSPSRSINNTMTTNSNSSISTPVSSPDATNSQNNQSMSNFIKKFSKTKFLSNVYGGQTGLSSDYRVAIGNHRTSTIGRLSMNDACPPIPEDDSVLVATSTSTTNNSTSNNIEDKDHNKCSPLKHNCKSTWV